MTPMPATRAGRSVTRWQHLPVPVRKVLVRGRRLASHHRPPQPDVSVDVRDGLAVVTFDDGKVNVLSHESAQLLSGALDRVTRDDGVKGLVVAGRPGQFSAGFDLDALMIGGDARRRLIETGWTMMLRLYRLPIPVVVACTGNAIAAGALLLLAGDRRLVADGDFKIGFNEAAIGLPLPGLLLMVAEERLAPDALEEATTGARLYSPHDAVAAGFATKVVPAADLLSAATAEARRLIDLPDEEFARAKRAAIRDRRDSIDRQLRVDLELMTTLGA